MLRKSVAMFLGALLTAGVFLCGSTRPCTVFAGETVTISSFEEQILTNADRSAAVDLADLSEGHITARYDGNAAKARSEITDPAGRVTSWPLIPDKDTVITLGSGDGTYRIRIEESAGGQNYAAVFSASFEAVIPDPLAPFLSRSLFVSWADDSLCAKKAAELYEEHHGDAAAFTDAVYRFIITEIAYDSEISAEVPADYVPDPDRTLSSGKGICFDYASLMAAMLRSCGVPARILSGYFGDYRHAFVQAAPGAARGPADTEDASGSGRAGKSNEIVWKSYDPTLGASNDAAAVRKCLSDMDSHYIIRQVY